MAKQGPAVQTEIRMKHTAEEAAAHGLGRVQGHCLDVQRWDQESQSRDSTELGKAYEKHYEGIL